MSDQVQELREGLRDLTAWHSHVEPYMVRTGGTTWSRRHRTLVPPLLAQLESSVEPGSAGGEGPGGYGSKPAVNLEAVDTLIHIDLEAARWVRDLGEDDPGTTIRCVRKLGALIAGEQRCGRGPVVDAATRQVVCCTWHAVAKDVRRWVTQARVATGWESPAWRPDNTCPVCGVRGKLRVRLMEQAGLCVECRATWDPSSIGLLAEHIRVENHDQEGQAGDTPGDGGVLT